MEEKLYFIKESDLNCPICQEPWINKDPRILSCQHSFCFVCISRVYKNGSIVCPICREETFLVDGLNGYLQKNRLKEILHDYTTITRSVIIRFLNSFLLNYIIPYLSVFFLKKENQKRNQSSRNSLKFHDMCIKFEIDYDMMSSVEVYSCQTRFIAISYADNEYHVFQHIDSDDMINFGRILSKNINIRAIHFNNYIIDCKIFKKVFKSLKKSKKSLLELIFRNCTFQNGAKKITSFIQLCEKITTFCLDLSSSGELCVIFKQKKLIIILFFH